MAAGAGAARDSSESTRIAGMSGQSGVNRREFCRSVAAATVVSGVARPAGAIRQSAAYNLVAASDRARILKAAEDYVGLPPVTITAFPTPLSPGGPHDFFSQADYFWPDPKNPNGPYVNRDGQSNPANFNEHRKAMIALSVRMPALTAAWRLTGAGGMESRRARICGRGLWRPPRG